MVLFKMTLPPEKQSFRLQTGSSRHNLRCCDARQKFRHVRYTWGEFYSYQNSGLYMESNGAESTVTQAKIVTLMDSTEVKGRETNAAGHWQHTDATRELKEQKCELHQ